MNDVKIACSVFFFSGLFTGVGLLYFFFTFEWQGIVFAIVACGLGFAYGFGSIFGISESQDNQRRYRTQARENIRDILREHNISENDEIGKKLHLVMNMLN